MRMHRPAPRGESIEIHTSDGVALRATLHEPERARGTAVLAHAAFARRSEFDADGGSNLTAWLLGEGWRTLAFDFRGHGESGTCAARGGDWTYDQLVSNDLPAVVSSARARWDGPLAVVGHALGGHAALAAAATGAIDCDAVCAVGTNVWLPQFEPSRARWRAKRAAAEIALGIVRARGYLPGRALRLGTDDECAAFVAWAVRSVRSGRWTSEDGSVDYEHALTELRVPVLGIAAAGDRLRCVPECAERMIARCGGPTEFRCIADPKHGSSGDAPGPRPTALLEGPRAKSVFVAIADFLAHPPTR